MNRNYPDFLVPGERERAGTFPDFSKNPNLPGSFKILKHRSFRSDEMLAAAAHRTFPGLEKSAQDEGRTFR